MVLLAHSIRKNTYLWIFINQFHMPLFFLISGYLYSCKGRFIDFIYKKIKGLYIPFVFSSLVMYIIYIIIGIETFSLVDLILIFGMHKTGPLLGAMWFLRALFWALIIYDQLHRIVKDKKIVCFLSFVLLIIGVHITFPFRISNIMVAMGFIAIGDMAKEYQFKCNKWLWIPCFSIVYIASLFIKASVSTNIYTIPLLFIVTALIGSIGTLSMAYLMMESKCLVKPLCWLGKNTIGIVIWQFVSFKIVAAIQIFVYKLEWERILDFPVIYEYATVKWVVCDILLGILGSVAIYCVQDRITCFALKPVDAFLEKIK